MARQVPVSSSRCERYRERLASGIRQYPLQFHVATALRNDLESEPAQDSHHFLTGEAPKPWQGKPPVRT